MPSLLGEDPENQICYQLLLIFSTIERDKRIKSAASLVFFTKNVSGAGTILAQHTM